MVYFILTLIICAVCGYLLGSINTSLIVGKFYKIDVRNYGSGNAGATNVLRTLGKKAALFTFIGDFLKGVAACLAGAGIVLLVMNVFGDGVFGNSIFGYILSGAELRHIPAQSGLMAAGAACVVGHNWPLYFGFKGGKGVLTTFSVFLMMAPVPALITLVFFVLVVALTRYVSLSSMLAAMFLPIFVFVTYLLGWDVGVENIRTYLIFCVPLVVLVVVRHKKNIKKLLNGTENKLNFKKVKGGIE